MSKDTNQERIVKAAEALVQAAGMEVDSLTQQKLCSNLDDLKSSFDNKLEAVSKSINTVNQNIMGLKDSMKKEVKDLLAKQEKRQKLEFAISSSLSRLGAFGYTDIEDRNSYRDSKKSHELVDVILKWFAIGHGYNLPVNFTIASKKELFRTKLVKQLEQLIGHKPRLVDDGSGKVAVYYE